MFRKIKSIKIIKDYPGNIYTVSGNIDPNQSSYEDCVTYLKYPEFFEIQYESDQLFFDNGAIVNAPEEGTKIYYRDQYGDIDTIMYGEEVLIDFHHKLASQELFLTYEAADKWKDITDTHNKILAKIKSIDAESNWMADWSDEKQWKYRLFWNYYGNCKDCGDDLHNRGCDTVMSEQAKDYMMSDAVSNEDFRKFLLIVD